MSLYARCAWECSNSLALSTAFIRTARVACSVYRELLIAVGNYLALSVGLIQKYQLVVCKVGCLEYSYYNDIGSVLVNI